ncbi:11255_t:CDS:2 [Acaulospora morrowiae]|uniref:11255_t:CDS:1 n=1 Tax=Acaulospora morrowiae TaxID=94023 RepID=A0A9N9GZH7_9GLOM|nr:11255_t:CDS:2 [Acaulospora morrowiae]
MAETYWVNPFQMLRFNGNEKPTEFTSKEAGVVDDECENGVVYFGLSGCLGKHSFPTNRDGTNEHERFLSKLFDNENNSSWGNYGKLRFFSSPYHKIHKDLFPLSDNSIIRTHSSRSPTPGSYTKKSSPPYSTPTRRRHSFISPDDKHNPPSPQKGINYMPLTPTKVVTTADAAAVFAASLVPQLNYEKKLQHQTPSHKYTSDEKQHKKQLKRSISFNHSNPVSPRQTPINPYIDVAEVLATTVSFVRENNKKLDRLSDEVRSEGHSSDNDSYFSDDSTDSWPHQSSGSNKEFENEITMLSVQLDSMEQKYKEQIRGKNKLIEELERTLKRRDKEDRKKCLEIERLEGQLEASKRAIAELVEQQQLETLSGNQSSDLDQSEALILLEQELEEKNKIIEDLTKKIQISTRRVNESKEKEKKFEAISSQLLKYQTLETEWQGKQKTLDSLSSQLEILRKREAEIHEKDSLIESLNIRLDTSQKVIAELREKRAPVDLLGQLRHKDYIIDDLTQQLENIDANLKDKDDEIESLSSQLASESKKVEKLKDQNSQIDPLKKRVEEADGLVYDMRQQVAQKERALAELERKHQESLRNSTESAEKLKAQEQSAIALRQEVAQLRQAITAQASEAREKDRILSSLKDETAHFRSNYQGLINAVTERDQRIAQFEKQLEILQNVPKVEPQEKEKETKISKLNTLQKVLNSKIEACRDYEKKITDLEKEFDGIKKQLEESKNASSEKEIKITRLVKMNRQLKDEVTELKEKMEAKEQELITIKSRIPKPAQTKSPASSVRSASKTPKSRVSSIYSVSGGESSGDETANGSRLRRQSSLNGIESPLRNSSTRRVSDSPRATLIRTKSSTSTSSIESPRSSIASLQKPRTFSTPSTVDVLKKKRDATITPKKEPSPINRSAVNQRKRDMVVLNHMLSGVVAPDRKNRSSTLATQKATVGKTVARKKPTDTISSDSDREVKSEPARKRTSDLATIMESTRPKVTRASVNKKTPITPVKTRPSLTRPLPSKKSSTTA